MSFYSAFTGRSHLAPQADPSVTSSVTGSNMALIVLEKQAQVTGIEKDCLSYSFCLRDVSAGNLDVGGTTTL